MDEQQRLKYLNRAEKSAHQLTHMLDDMLIVSQLETDHFELRPERLRIAEFMQEIVDEFQTIHAETCSPIFKSPFDDTIVADSRLLRQIAANLISNAIKYSPQGREVQVLLEYEDGQMSFSVRDQGIGILKADQSRLFTAFQRASNVGRISGTGLGLAIVKEAVDLHSGTVNLDSEIGVGTTVMGRIPIQR